MALTARPPRGALRPLLVALGAALVAAVACSSSSTSSTGGADGGAEGGAAGRDLCKPTCPNDPPLAGDMLTDCKAAVAKCGREYAATLDCLTSKGLCGADGKTDIDRALKASEACATVSEAYIKCAPPPTPSDGGGGTCPKKALGEACQITDCCTAGACADPMDAGASRCCVFRETDPCTKALDCCDSPLGARDCRENRCCSLEQCTSDGDCCSKKCNMTSLRCE